MHSGYRDGIWHVERIELLNQEKIRMLRKKETYLFDSVCFQHSPGILSDLLNLSSGGARGVVVITVGNEHGDTSSNPGRD